MIYSVFLSAEVQNPLTPLMKGGLDGFVPDEIEKRYKISVGSLKCCSQNYE